jgi:XTP/dITP diphosphohydrolase
MSDSCVVFLFSSQREKKLNAINKKVLPPNPNPQELPMVNGDVITLPEKIVIATRNPGKVREISDLVQELPVKFLSLEDLEARIDVVEDGETFEENALKKAKETAQATGLPALADDSGLCVDALGGRPGVLSARYGGDGASDSEKCEQILAEMARVRPPKRSARFVCVLVLSFPGGREEVFRGVCEGAITDEQRGAGGFGYDPIFYYGPAKCTFGEMARDEKNRVSHRGGALRQLAEYLKALA